MNFVEALKVAQEKFKAHPHWRMLLGTPWENDAAVIAAELMLAEHAELTHLRAVAGALRRFLGAGISEAKEAWIPEWLSKEYEALVDAWLALPSELRDALAAWREGRGEGKKPA